MKLLTYVAEDNDFVLQNLIETLQELAHVQVAGHAATEAEACTWLSSPHRNWHLAILDLFLREGSGFAVLAGCRGRQPQQKVVVLTNYATLEVRRQAAALGVDAVFDKSSELENLFTYCIDHASKVAAPGLSDAR